MTPPSLPARILIALIRLYQRYLSPDTGMPRVWFPFGCCRFTPTCSAYTIDALARYGLILGLWYGFRRILRCHPWQQGGFDPIA